MPFPAAYSNDVEFSKLLARGGAVDLAVLALEIARDAYPGLDFAPTLNWIDARAASVAGRLSNRSDDLDALRVLADCLAGEFGVGGDPSCFAEPDSSYLNRVVKTGRGIPISLSLLYVAVARRAGISLDGVCAPAHFLARYEAATGPVFVDAFSSGRILEFDECLEWLADVCGRPAEWIEQTLHAGAPRPIAVRMLNNLKSIYAGKSDWNALWNVQQRLAALEPSSYDQRRDLAVTAQRSNRSGVALDLLKACLRDCPEEERDMLEAELEQARSRLPRWN